MDGIIINFFSWNNGQCEFIIQATQGAGQKPLTLKSNQHCIEIMTGAVVPENTDCVIPIEQIQIKDGKAVLDPKLKLAIWQNIRRQGDDHRKGKRLIEKGCLLNAAHIAVAVSVGKTNLRVSTQSKIAIISTGDEIVSLNTKAKVFQIYPSNSAFLKAAFDHTGLFESSVFHFADHKKVLLREIKKILKNFDVLVLTGGVSMGKFDYVPQVLEELGVKVLFHKVEQKPGKPFWFGKSKNNQPVFALPGNPVSTQVGACRYVIPHLKNALGLNAVNPEYAVLKKNFRPDSTLTFFLLVKIICNSKGLWEAEPVMTRGSGDLAATAKADGFMEIPPHKKIIQAGFVGRVYRW